jgi:uncharacterized protein (TIGR02246 family)
MISTTSTNDISFAIRKANDMFETTFGNGDAAGMAALYTENGTLLPTGTDLIQGRDAIRNFWQGVMDMGVKKAQLKTLEVEEQGDTAIEMGNFILKGENNTALDQGKYIVVWKHQEGQWRLDKDIWNSSLAPIL